MFTITDTIASRRTATVDADQIAEAISPWFSLDPLHMVTDAIQGLQTAAMGCDPIDEFADSLGVRLRRHP